MPNRVKPDIHVESLDSILQDSFFNNEDKFSAENTSESIEQIDENMLKDSSSDLLLGS